MHVVGHGKRDPAKALTDRSADQEWLMCPRQREWLKTGDKSQGQEPEEKFI